VTSKFVNRGFTVCGYRIQMEVTGDSMIDFGSNVHGEGMVCLFYSMKSWITSSASFACSSIRRKIPLEQDRAIEASSST